METKWTREEVLQKIQKLFKLAEGTSYEEEAKAAMERAHKMLREYDLSMSDVELTEETGDISSAETESFHFTYAFIWRLAKCASQLTNTTYFREKRLPKNGGKMMESVIRFIGTKTDIAAAVSLFHYLERTVKLMAATSEYRSRASERTSYCNGVSVRLQERVEEIKRCEKADEEAEAGSRTTAIVLVKDKAIKEYLKEEGIKIRKCASNFAGNLYSPFQAGIRDGNSVALHQNKELTHA